MSMNDPGLMLSSFLKDLNSETNTNYFFNLISVLESLTSFICWPIS